MFFKRNKNTKSIFRAVLITIMLLFLLSKEINIVKNYKSNINTLHLGEKISTSRLVSVFNIEPSLDTFILHGYFIETLEGLLAFKLFGVSIGSFLFFDALLLIFSFGLFLLFLSISLKNDLVFLIAGLFFLGTQLKFRIVNNLIFLIYLLYCNYVINKKKPTVADFTIQFLLVFISFFYAVEIAYYQLASQIIFVVLIIQREENCLKKKEIIKKNIWGLINGLTLALISGWLFLRKGLSPYLKNLIFKVPNLSYTIFKPTFPKITTNFFNPYYLPLILVFINLIFLFVIKRERKKTADGKNLFQIVFIFLIGFIYLYGIFARSNPIFIEYDRANISYFLTLQFLTFFMLLDFLIQKKDVKKIFCYAVLCYFCLFPFFKYKNLMPVEFSKESFKFFVSLTKIKDNYWINSEQKEVVRFIKRSTTKKDYVFVFNNEALYYYLFERNNPTKFIIPSIAEPKPYQQQIIRDLSKTPPKYVIYFSKNWPNNLDNISQQERLYIVNNWLLNNYKTTKKIKSTLILY